MKPPRRRTSKYLWHRPTTDIVWFSRAVPKALWVSEGRRVIQFPLGTTDRREAEVLARRHAAELDERWGLLAREPRLLRAPTIDEIEALAVEAAYDPIVDYEEQRRRGVRARGLPGLRDYVRRSAINLDTQREHAVMGETTLVSEIADIVIEDRAFDLPRGSDGYALLLEQMVAARLAGLRVSHERARGNLDADTDSPLVRRVRERDRTKAKPGETIEELFERWASDRLAKGEKRTDTVNQDRKVIAQFAQFVGSDRAIGSITPVMVAEYRDLLRQLPPKWRANKALMGLDMRAAAVRAREMALPESAFTSINKHLSTISPLYKWLAAQPAWAGLVNPCVGLFHDKVKGKNRRPSLSTSVLNKIIASPLFTGFLADGKEHRPGNQQADDWRKWIPLVCLFTGARIGEVAQLRLGDVRQERGVWFVHVRHDEAAGLTTKSGKSRPAAVHATLEQIGFLAFHSRQVERAANDLTAPLFPELKPNSRGQISGIPSRFWREYLTAIGVKDGGDGLGAHSFRHTLADRLRSEVELLDDQIEVVLGHNQKTVTSGYGELPQGTVTMFKGWMDALRFDGVDFSRLTVSSAGHDEPTLR